MKQAHLVYQYGIANLFTVDAQNVLRHAYQGDFRTAENMARGIKLCDVPVGVWHCDEPGDALHLAWGIESGDMFKESKAKHI